MTVSDEVARSRRDFQFAVIFIAACIWVTLLSIAGIFALVRLIEMGW